MIGTAPLVIRQVGLINRSHVHAKPLPDRWPRMRHSGDGVFTPHFPAEIDGANCAASDHLTFNKVRNWRVTTGEFDPYDLYSSTLKRSTPVNAVIFQVLPTISLNTSYNVAITGSCTVAFNSTTQQWGDGSTSNAKTFTSTGGWNIHFYSGAPTTISVFFNNNSDYLEHIQFREGTLTSPGDNLILNTSFDEIDSHFYDIESWYEDSKDNVSVPTDTLGWLEGFNDSQIFTVFE